MDEIDERFKNPYGLTIEQFRKLEAAEEAYEMHQLEQAESMFLDLLNEIPDCIPVLNNLGDLFGNGYNDFERAVEFYDRVLQLEPDNDWARTEKRRFSRYLSYD